MTSNPRPERASPALTARQARIRQEWRVPQARFRATGEAVVIPRPQQLHPERVPADSVATKSEPPSIARSRREASVREPGSRHEWNVQLILVAALPVLAGILLLVFGLDPEAVVLRW
jgi:hypothetical protein